MTTNLPSACTAAPQTWTLTCNGRALQLGGRALIMGILNITPDSFSDGGRSLAPADAVRHALAMEAAGADLIDIGGESTRPGAAPVSAEAELRRVMPVIEALREQIHVPLSIDTSKATVARAALAAGVALVNDVTALRGDAAMASVVAEARCPVILMHMQGTPQTMQQQPHYDDVVSDVRASLTASIAVAEAAGIARDRILLDPGIGFGKTSDHNLALLAHLPALAELGRPIVVGPSRKAFIGQLLDRPADARLHGTAAAVAVAAWLGAAVVRVHDVVAMRDVVEIVHAIGARRTA